MEAVQIRQRGAEDFAAYYESLCALQDICPVASIRAGVKEGVLNCHIRRLKKDDWHPVLTALKINKVLHTVVFYEKWEERVYPAIKNLATDDALRKFCSKPAPRSLTTTDKHTIFSIAKTLQDCISVSLAVKSLALEGIPLLYRDCKTLAKGLLKNHSVAHLSFKGSGIGDRATEIICDALRDSHSVEWIDLTACGLTSQGTAAVASVIKHQCLQRQSAAWKDSLRFHQPRLGQMPGLRRVTLNLNTEVGDKGAKELADTLRDDVCLKALDLQSCGVTTDGAKLFIEVLKFNSCLMVLDIRANALIDDDVIDVIHEQLKINVTGMDKSEESYVWLDVEVERIFHEIKLTQVPAPAVKRKNGGQHKTSSLRAARSSQIRRRYSSHSNGHVRRGIPWRAAARSSQRWKIINNQSSVTIKRCSVSSEPAGSTTTPSDSNERTSLKAELSTCYRRLREEIRARAKAEAYIAELEEQNRQLSQQLREMEAKAASTSDDHMLEAVEATFKQFSTFLDLLHDKGWGNCVPCFRVVQKIRNLMDSKTLNTMK